MFPKTVIYENKNACEKSRGVHNQQFATHFLVWLSFKHVGAVRVTINLFIVPSLLSNRAYVHATICSLECDSQW